MLQSMSAKISWRRGDAIPLASPSCHGPLACSGGLEKRLPVVATESEATLSCRPDLHLVSSSREKGAWNDMIRTAVDGNVVLGCISRRHPIRGPIADYTWGLIIFLAGTDILLELT